MKTAWKRIISRRKYPSRMGGQGMVEFALAFPVFLLLMFLVIEGGNLLLIYSSVVSASREGARYGAGTNHFTDTAGIRDAAKRAGVFAGLTDGNILITYDEGSSIYSTKPDCSGLYVGNVKVTPQPFSSVNYGDRIIVYINKSPNPITPGLHYPNGFCFQSWNAHTYINNIPGSGIPTATPTSP